MKNEPLLPELAYPSDALEDWLGRVRERIWQVEEEVSRRVGEILADVDKRGDDALLEWTNRLDERKLNSAEELRVAPELLQQAEAGLSEELRGAMQLARQRIETYHRVELREHGSWHNTDRLGVSQGRIFRPVRSSGAYVPGGKASYPSSVLMNLVPAQVAGVPRRLLCSPWPKGEYSPATLAAARLTQCEEVYSIGGAVAVAAMAFGTEVLPAVDMVSGPGNIWVAEAKRQIFGRVGVDMLAGPSEVLIIADETAHPRWVAADLCAQAEHDPEARAILVSDSPDLLAEVQQVLEGMVPALARAEIISESLRNRGAAILVSTIEEAVALSNRIAPEHLQLAVNLPGSLLGRVECAGAVFLGHASGEVFGDYITGSNHILPTGGTARFASPLGVASFLTEISFIDCPPPAASTLSDATRKLAEAEGLTAHALAASLRAEHSPRPTEADGD